DRERHHDRRDMAHHGHGEDAEGHTADERGRRERQPDAQAFAHAAALPLLHRLHRAVSYRLMTTRGKVTPESLPLRGGRLCLDFANTVDWTADGEPLPGGRTEALATPRELVRWGQRLELVG